MTLLTAEKQAVADAVETLYDVFSTYPLAQKVEGCPCCVSAEDEAALHLRSLRRMMAQDLGRYAFKALSTWGDEDDLRHFLPRLLELAAELHHCEVDLQVVSNKLQYETVQQWPEQEQQAIRKYLLALWRLLLILPSEEVSLESYLGDMSVMEEDLTPYLALWHDTANDGALSDFLTFIDCNLDLHKRKILNWSGRKEQMTQVVDWLSEMGLA